MSDPSAISTAAVDGPPILARHVIHELVFAWFDRLPRGRVLDVPAGAGALSLKLHQTGFQVDACDINEDGFRVPGPRFSRGDLAGRLPYGDGVFDYAACIEGPEHMENPYQALRELGRVLRPGGKLVLSIPNYSNVERRLKYLLTGCFTKPVSQDALRERFGGSTAMMHLSPIGYPILKFALEAAGFRIEGLQRDKVKYRQYLIFPLWLVLKLMAALSSEARRKNRWTDEMLSTPIFWGGNTLIVMATR